MDQTSVIVDFLLNFIPALSLYFIRGENFHFV